MLFQSYPFGTFYLFRHRASFGKECAKIPTENMEKGLCDCPE